MHRLTRNGRAPFERTFHVERAAINTESRTVDLAFSSEMPYERWWGIEVLDHGSSSVRLGRLGGGQHPLLVNHDPNRQVGVVEKAWIGEDRMARSTVRFGRSELADEVFNDVCDGIRGLVSVGYQINEVEEQDTSKSGEAAVVRKLSGAQFRSLVDSDDFKRSLEERKARGDEPPVFRVTDWEPYEVSIVAIPADPSVGVGRSAPPPEAVTVPPIIKEMKTMDDEQKKAAEIKAAADEARRAAGEQEANRVREILALGNHYKLNDAAEKAVREGAPVDAFRQLVLAEIEKKAAARATAGDIGMSKQEVKNFSYLRAIRALMNPQDAKLQEEAAFEREVSRAAAQASGKAERGFIVPTDVLNKRDLITGTATSTAKGGNLIQTDVLGASFIDVLRNAMVLPSLGARFLTGLQGNVAIPKRTTSVTAYWPGENTAPTEGTNVFGQVTMSPKVIAAYIDIGRRLAIQSSVDVEALVRDDLAKTLAIGIDLAAIGGATTNGPTGVRGTSGIGSVAIGTNGGAPTWASVAGLIKAVETSNALNGSLAFLTNPKVRYKLMTTSKQSSGVEGNFILNPDANTLAGYPLVVSNQVTSSLTKGSSSGVCSAMFFANWSELIVGQWGGIELMVDPYSLSTTGATRIVSLAEVDVCVRHAESFAAVLDYTTT